jgi:uncharacterized protein YqjF (DUF2071 family)
MGSIKEILHKTSHRPFPYPDRDWKYYQEWHNVIFAHWKVSPASLTALIPQGLDIDLYNGEAWVSLVAFTLKNLRPHYLPPCPAVSDFHEINIRTYVLRRNKPGIFFLSLEAHKSLSAMMVSLLGGLNYYKSNINHQRDYHESENIEQLFYLKSSFHPGDEIEPKNELDKWLTDRFCLFHEVSGKIYRRDIHHDDWDLKPVEISSFEINYRFKELLIKDRADLFHYSDGVQVPTWGKVKAY